MKKFAILAGLMSLALVIGVAGTSFHPGKAEAKPTDVVAINPDVCASIIGQYEGAATIADCYHLDVPADLAAIADVLGGSVDDPDTYADLVDASDAQLGEDATDASSGGGPFTNRFNSQSMWVLTFVSNDDNLSYDADEGVWLDSGASTADCSVDIGDEDCDGNGTTGDGVVVELLYSGVNDGSNTLDRGDASATISDSDDVTLDYTVVGAPDDFTVKALETSLQGDSGGTCELPSYHDDAAYTAIVGQPDVAGLLGTVVDDDNTELTGIWVGWLTSDADVADVADNTGTGSGQFEHTATIAKGTVVAAPNLACGGDAGDVTIDAGVVAGPTVDVSADDVLDPDDSVDLTVIGAPSTMTVASNPAQITCNGTTAGEVDATVLNSAGKPVAAGNKVRFDVVALGTANPIVATTDANGVAKTNVTPLSGVTAGVTVIATVEEQYVDLNDDLTLVRTTTDSTDIEANALVSCAQAVPTVPAVVPPGGNVTPPRTGDGGYLP